MREDGAPITNIIMADIYCLMRRILYDLSEVPICVRDFPTYFIILIFFQLNLPPFAGAPHLSAPFPAQTSAELRLQIKQRENRLSVDRSVKTVELSRGASTLDKKWLWKEHTFPSPVEDPKECSSDHPSYICNPDGLLERSEGR